MREEPTETAAAIAPNPSSRPVAMRGGGGGGGGEIVEVQGGHIVRSTGRKDRHSKVCTAKGPRDRRVRLSAHTAIQFYDVQDRLGYDRPSKAVDWLIKKAKTAIDELAQLPAWNPTATCSSSLAPQQQQHHRQSPVDDPVIASSNRTLPEPEQFTTTSQQQQLGDNNNNNSSSGKYKYNSVGSASGSGFLPGSLDTDIADTIKSFFPTATTSFQNYQPPPDLLSRTPSGGGGGSQQDLRLSLQSFQDPAILLQQQHHQQQQHVPFAGTTAALGFDGGWSEQQQQQDEHEHGRLLHRMVAWNANAAADAGGNSGHGAGFVFGAAPAVPVFGGHGQYFSQRGPLQSSNTPSVRAWINPSMTATAVVADHHNHHHSLLSAVHQASVSSGGFSASGGGFSGFRIPARIQGGEEHDGVSDKPSSASSASRH